MRSNFRLQIEVRVAAQPFTEDEDIVVRLGQVANIQGRQYGNRMEQSVRGDIEFYTL